MKKNSKFVSVKELRERWQVDKIDILNILKKEGLTCLNENHIGQEIDKYTKQGIIENIELIWIDEYYCLRSEIESYEKKHPELKPQDAPYVSSKGEIPPYLDKKHPHYSTELATSIEIWMQLFQSGAPIKNQSLTLVGQIKAALKEKGFTGPRESSRLASGINPDYNKRGGGTRTKIKVTSKRTVKK